VFQRATFTSSLVLTAALTFCFGCSKPYTPNLDPTDNWGIAIAPDLPNVLIIGDSISIGYTQEVRQLLEGKANVLRPMRKVGTKRKRVNCRDTRFGLENLENWLGDSQWDVIHFNWGLHDLCYRNPQAKNPRQRDKINGRISVPLAQYQDNLEQLVVRLKSTGAVLIWASTTFVPEGEIGRFAGDEQKYNDKARLVMAKHGIAVNDLHVLTSNFENTLFRGPGDVHYTKEGSRIIAAQVAENIEQALKNQRY
jgi:hypothetical protein